jgi:hypothetical protein
MGSTVSSSPIMRFSQANVLASLPRFLADFDEMFAAVSNHRSVSVAGTTICVGSNDPRYLDQVACALATRGTSAEPNCRILVISDDDQLSPMPFWPQHQFREREIEALLAETPYHLHYFDTLNFWQFYDAERRIGIQWMAGPAACPAWDAGSPLRNFLQWHLGAKDRSLLHGGTLAVDGSGVLLAGEGGSGKSSTVLAGIFAGLQSVGDDYVLIDATTKTARPVFDTLKQDEAGLRRLGKWDHPTIPAEPNWQGKYQFYLPDISTETVPSQIDLRAILLPHLTYGRQTSFTAMDAKSAFLALAPSGVSQIHCDRVRLFSVAGQIARQLPAFRLDLGTHPDEIVTALSAFLRTL